MGVFLVSSYVLYFMADLEGEAYHLPFVIWYMQYAWIIFVIWMNMTIFFLYIYLLNRFPFEWRDPIGYFVAVLLEAPTFYYAPLVFIFDLFFVFGICKLLAAFVYDIEAELQSLNKHPETNTNMYTIIKLYLTTKQLSHQKKQINLMTQNAKCIVRLFPFIDWCLSSVTHWNSIFLYIFCGRWHPLLNYFSWFTLKLVWKKISFNLNRQPLPMKYFFSVKTQFKFRFDWLIQVNLFARMDTVVFICDLRHGR